jgi:aminomethyltransferase
VTTPNAKDGTAVKLNIRGKMVDAAVTKMPFVPCHYYRAP